MNSNRTENEAEFEDRVKEKLRKLTELKNNMGCLQWIQKPKLKPIVKLNLK